MANRRIDAAEIVDSQGVHWRKATDHDMPAWCALKAETVVHGFGRAEYECFERAKWLGNGSGEPYGYCSQHFTSMVHF